jgi:hypothetical protein
VIVHERMAAVEPMDAVESMEAVEVTTWTPPRKPVALHGIARRRDAQNDCSGDENGEYERFHDALTSHVREAYTLRLPARGRNSSRLKDTFTFALPSTTRSQYMSPLYRKRHTDVALFPRSGEADTRAALHAELQHALSVSVDQPSATAKILRVIAASRTDLEADVHAGRRPHGRPGLLIDGMVEISRSVLLPWMLLEAPHTENSDVRRRMIGPAEPIPG